MSIVSTERSAELKVSSRLPCIVPCVLSAFCAVTGERRLGAQLPRPFLNMFLEVCTDLSGVVLAVNILLLTAVYLFDSASRAWSYPLTDLSFLLSGLLL